MNEAVALRRAAMEKRHPAWVETSLDLYLRRAAGDYGARDLVITDAQILSYEQVLRHADRIAAWLEQFGILRGDRVGMVLPNEPMVVPLLFAIWKLGAVAVPINTLYRTEELSFIIRQSACKLLIVIDELFGRRFADDLGIIAPGWREGLFETLPDLETVILHDRAPESPLSLPSLDTAPAEVQGWSRAKPQDPAVIMYTSGTTGMPKGVLQTHDNLLRAAFAGAYHQAFEDGRRAVFSLPLYHAFGLVVGLLSGLVVGGAIIPLLRFDPAKLLTAIGRHRATFLMGVPTMTIALLEQAAQEAYDLSTLTAIHSAAAPTPSWVWEAIRKSFGCCEIFTSYGQTETTATIICTQPGDPIEIVSTTQGTVVLAGVAGIPEQGGRIAEFKVIDPETGDDLPPGAVGEICTCGPLNSQGYFRRAEETAKILLDGGWIRTGDLGRFREDGYLVLTGRLKEVYKSRGELVSPKEIEDILTTHPAVSQAFVIGMPDDRWGECGCAWVVPAGSATLTESEMIAFLQSRIARYKLPRNVWFIKAGDLPRTGTGKVQKDRLKEMAAHLPNHAGPSP